MNKQKELPNRRIPGSVGMAADADPRNPIRGLTTSTVASVGLRVSVLGIRPDALREMESEGNSSCNGPEASLAKYWSRGLQFLASYPFSKTPDSDAPPPLESRRQMH